MSKQKRMILVTLSLLVMTLLAMSQPVPALAASGDGAGCDGLQKALANQEPGSPAFEKLMAKIIERNCLVATSSASLSEPPSVAQAGSLYGLLAVGLVAGLAFVTGAGWISLTGERDDGV